MTAMPILDHTPLFMTDPECLAFIIAHGAGPAEWSRGFLDERKSDKLGFRPRGFGCSLREYEGTPMSEWQWDVRHAIWYRGTFDVCGTFTPAARPSPAASLRRVLHAAFRRALT